MSDMAASHPLVVTHLGKEFDGFTAVKDLSFSVARAEVLGIVGPNGAGKSTTVKMILGLLEPTKGSVTLFGDPITKPEVRRRIGYMPETPSFYAYLTGRELLDLAGGLFGYDKKKIMARTEELLGKVGLTEAADRPLHSYSKGMLQRVCLGQALFNEPELLFLDEPLDGLDPIGRIRMREILTEVKANGTAIVLNSHILSDVQEMSDRIAIMDRGSILKLEPVSALVPKGKDLEDVFIETIESKATTR